MLKILMTTVLSLMLVVLLAGCSGGDDAEKATDAGADAVEKQADSDKPKCDHPAGEHPSGDKADSTKAGGDHPKADHPN